MKLQGREILQSTVALVQNNLNLEVCNPNLLLKNCCLTGPLIWLLDPLFCIMQVIYGDTDSIMIYTGLDDIAKAKAIAGKVIQEVRLTVS